MPQFPREQPTFVSVSKHALCGQTDQIEMSFLSLCIVGTEHFLFVKDKTCEELKQPELCLVSGLFHTGCVVVPVLALGRRRGDVSMETMCALNLCEVQ